MTAEGYQAVHPPEWPTTGSPRRIAILGWARLALQAAEGTGYNLSASELAAGLAMMGHTVIYLSSGMAYSPRPGIRIRFRESWRGVACHEVVNSPVLSPSAANFANAAGEISQPALTERITAFLDRHRVELVHAHALEGFSMDLVGAVRSTGRPFIITPHNYWYVCPQVDLLHREHELCMDYEGGRRCERCLEASTVLRQKYKRIITRASERALGPKQTELIRLKLKRTLKRSAAEAELPTRVDRNLLPEEAVARGHDIEQDDDGLLRHRFMDSATVATEPPVPLEPDTNERFCTSSDVHLRVMHPLGGRRSAGVRAMSAADLITPPSEFNRELHASMGVPRVKIRVVRYGQPHFDQINRRARRSPFYRCRPWDPATATRPLRFGFFGTTRPNKGLDILARAVPLLERDIRQRCQFIIRAQGNDWPFRKRLAPYPEVNFLGGYDILQLINAAGEYDVGLLPHIWFDNSPLVMWEHLHAGKMIIASRLGGAADTIRSLDDSETGNGLFFAGGRPDDLARQITRVVTGEVGVPSAAEVHAASELQTYPGHVAEVDGLYADLLRGLTEPTTS
ncbi:MAG: glycosyltransferase [Planctomycetota bacterium]